MRVLVTGAAGFLGRHIVAAAAGHVVIKVTRASQSSSPDEIALGNGRWTQDVLRDLLATAHPDVVIHCAGRTHSKTPDECFDANTILAAGLMKAAGQLTNPPRIILIGSAAEYGNVPPSELPVAEAHRCQPYTDYGIAKYAQTLLGTAAAARGQPVLTVRLFNPVGVGMPRLLALPSFVRQIVGPAAKPVLHVGDISVQRDFLDVEEAARVIMALASYHPWPWPVVNLCSGHAYRIGDLLDGIIAASSAKVEIEADAKLMRPGEMPVLVGSTKRLEALNLKPTPPDFQKLFLRLIDEATAAE